MKKVSKALSFFFIFLAFPLFAAKEKPLFPLSIEHIGKGNASLTTARDSKAIFFNPALISLAQDKFYLIDLGFGNSKVINEIFQDAGVVEDRILDDEPLLGKIFFSGPLFLGIKTGNFQGVFFQDFSLTFDAFAIFPPHPDAGAYGKISLLYDTGVALGTSFLVPINLTGSKWEYLYAGISLKIFNRVKAGNNKLGFDDFAAMGNPIQFVEDELGLARAISFTFDFGLVYFYEDFALGITLYNPLSFPLHYKPTKIPFVFLSSSDTQIETTSLPFDMGFGFSYTIPQITNVSSYFLKNLTFSLDFQDLTNWDDYPDFIQKVRFGLEVTLAQVINVRAGFYHGAATFGIGYEFLVFKIDAAYWGEKVGNKKNLNWGMRLAVEF